MLNFDNGLKKVYINNTEDFIEFSPTDPNFVKGLYSLVDELEVVHRTLSETLGNSNDIIGDMDKAEEEERKRLDKVLGEGASAKVFGSSSVFTVKNGSPNWANFIISILDVCDKGLRAEIDIENPVLKRLRKKYEKRGK